jgi:hypothetical protein
MQAGFSVWIDRNITPGSLLSPIVLSSATLEPVCPPVSRCVWQASDWCALSVLDPIVPDSVASFAVSACFSPFASAGEDWRADIAHAIEQSFAVVFVVVTALFSACSVLVVACPRLFAVLLASPVAASDVE